MGLGADAGTEMGLIVLSKGVERGFSMRQEGVYPKKVENH